METGIATTPFGRRPMSLAMVAAQKESREIPEGKAVDKWQVYRRPLRGQEHRRHRGSRPGGVERAAIVLSGQRTERGKRPDRLSLEQAAVAAGARDGRCHAAAAPGGLGGLRPHHPPGQPERQTVRPQGQGRGHRGGFRLLAGAAAGACGRVRGRRPNAFEPTTGRSG